MRKIDILIIDDSPAFTHLTKLTIQKAGLDCEITAISNGQRALSYLSETNKCPDVILLDINMPVMDGFDFLEEYVAKNKCTDEMLIYMLTSSSRDADRAKVKPYSIVRDYFEKPLSVEHMHKIMSDLRGE